MTVENRVHDAILTVLDIVVIPRVEMAMRSITESSMRGPSSMVHISDRRDLTGNTENTPLMLASSRLDLNVDQYRNEETLNVENSEDEDFLTLCPNFYRRTHAHHNDGIK